MTQVKGSSAANRNFHRASLLAGTALVGGLYALTMAPTSALADCIASAHAYTCTISAPTTNTTFSTNAPNDRYDYFAPGPGVATFTVNSGITISGYGLATSVQSANDT